MRVFVPSNAAILGFQAALEALTIADMTHYMAVLSSIIVMFVLLACFVITNSTTTSVEKTATEIRVINKDNNNEEHVMANDNKPFMFLHKESL
jgi:hypothetical protein